MTKRKKPTAAQLVDRIYRRVTKFEGTLLNQMAIIRIDISSARRQDREIMRPIVEHCERLLREKEILARRCEALHVQVRDAKAPTLTDSVCKFGHLHQPNIVCHGCGHLHIDPKNYISTYAP